MNCAASLPPATRFCGHCGQDHRHPRLRLADLAQDAASELWSLDRPWFRTVRGLFPQAGTQSRESLAGRRVGVVGPLRFLLVALAVHVVCNQIAVTWLGAADATVSRWVPVILLALGPAVAFLLKFFGPIRGLDLAELMVPTFYAMAATTLGVAVLRLADAWLPLAGVIGLAMAFYFLVLPCYWAFTLVRFFPCAWWRALLLAYGIGGVGAIGFGSAMARL